MGDYPPDWDRRRKEVLERDDYSCGNCGYEGKQGAGELHVHHIVPLEKGGSNQAGNLTVLCSDCHSAVHGSGMAPTHQPDEANHTLPEFSTEEVLRTYLYNRYPSEEVVEEILSYIDSFPVSYSRLKEAEEKGFDGVMGEQTTPAVRFQSSYRKERLQRFRDLSAKEKENLR